VFLDNHIVSLIYRRSNFDCITLVLGLMNIVYSVYCFYKFLLCFCVCQFAICFVYYTMMKSINRTLVKNNIWTYLHLNFWPLLFRLIHLELYYNIMILSNRIYWKLLIVSLLSFCYSQEFKGFDDTILYKINWPGKDVTDRLVKVSFKHFKVWNK